MLRTIDGFNAFFSNRELAQISRTSKAAATWIRNYFAHVVTHFHGKLPIPRPHSFRDISDLIYAYDDRSNLKTHPFACMLADRDCIEDHFIPGRPRNQLLQEENELFDLAHLVQEYIGEEKPCHFDHLDFANILAERPGDAKNLLESKVEVMAVSKFLNQNKKRQLLAAIGDYRRNQDSKMGSLVLSGMASVIVAARAQGFGDRPIGEMNPLSLIMKYASIFQVIKEYTTLKKEVEPAEKEMLSTYSFRRNFLYGAAQTNNIIMARLWLSIGPISQHTTVFTLEYSTLEDLAFIELLMEHAPDLSGGEFTGDDIVGHVAISANNADIIKFLLNIKKVPLLSEEERVHVIGLLIRWSSLDESAMQEVVQLLFATGTIPFEKGMKLIEEAKEKRLHGIVALLSQHIPLISSPKANPVVRQEEDPCALYQRQLVVTFEQNRKEKNLGEALKQLAYHPMATTPQQADMLSKFIIDVAENLGREEVLPFQGLVTLLVERFPKYIVGAENRANLIKTLVSVFDVEATMEELFDYFQEEGDQWKEIRDALREDGKMSDEEEGEQEMRRLSVVKPAEQQVEDEGELENEVGSSYLLFNENEYNDE